MKKTVAKKPVHKTIKKKAIIGARLLQRGDVVANTQKAIDILYKLAGDPKRRSRTRKATLTLRRILENHPKVGRKIIRALVRLDKTHSLSPSTVCRILAAPLALTTVKRHLKDFANKRISFSKLMDYVDLAYERQVPHKTMADILKCERGEFYNRIMRTALVYNSPKSLITNATIKRMHIMGSSVEEIKKANKLRWEIHRTCHEMHEAIRGMDKAGENKARQEMRGLQSVFVKEFTKTV